MAEQSKPEAGGRQAVVLIHGMGEQIPMETLKGFVQTIWKTDDDVVFTDARGKRYDGIWSKPDVRTGSLELRRFTTQRSRNSQAFPHGARTDFYELYWADLTAGSTWEQFTGWVRGLLLRTWSNTPKDVRLAWLALWGLSLLFLLLGLVGLVPDAQWRGWFPDIPQKWALAAAAAIPVALQMFARKTFGRVVRYTRADPDNIAARAAVRDRGLKLLRALHANDDYVRVVVVGHSLGTILAYDLVSYFWAEQASARCIKTGTTAFDALEKVEATSAGLSANEGDAARRAAFVAAQAGLRRELVKRSGKGAAPDARWLISDLVTLGSPLTHAEFLLAKDKADLRKRQDERETPTSPPEREALFVSASKKAGSVGLTCATHIVYQPDPEDSPDLWSLHHAAPFAVVRWTNVYDPARLVVMGDQISGPLRGAFGPGVVDIDLSTKGKLAGFTHTRYWDPDTGERLKAVRRAVNLLDD
jgi:hypothetical protein